MSDNRACQWCYQDKPTNEGQFRDGQWICFDCMPHNARLTACQRKCDLCKNRVDKGHVVGKSFFCVDCGSTVLQQFTRHYPQKTGKKKKKSWNRQYVEKSQPHVGAQQRKKEKKRNHIEVTVEVKIEKWKVVFEDISTGDL